MKSFAEDLSTGDNIKKIPTIGGPEVYAILFGSAPVADYLRTQFAAAARLGLLTAIDSATYRNLSAGSRNDARRIIRDFNRHNDKLGFDYSNTDRKYKVDLSEQFQGSAYPQFLQEASAFYAEKGETQLADHFANASRTFTIQPAERDDILRKQGRMMSLPTTAPNELKVQGL